MSEQLEKLLFQTTHYRGDKRQKAQEKLREFMRQKLDERPIAKRREPQSDTHSRILDLEKRLAAVEGRLAAAEGKINR